MRRPGQWIKTWEVALVGLLIAEILLFGLASPSFLNLDNLLFSTSDFAHIVLAALPLTLVIITGGIDISAAAMMGLTAIVLGVTWQSGANIFIALLIGVLVGALAGAFNGMLVANTDIPPLVITLGTLFLYSGLATGIAGSLGAAGYEGISGLPREFTRLANGSIGPIPNTLILVLSFALILAVILHRTRLGRSFYLVGVNAEAARFSGISVKAVIIAAYTLSGLGAALAGAMLTSYFTSARSDLGSDALLPAITAVVLGGANINGGSGTIAGTLLASLVLGTLKHGLLATGVTNDVSQVVIGTLLISIVAAKALLGVFNRYRLNQRALRYRAVAKGGEQSA
jgi:AI-2 transport system permease protein